MELYFYISIHVFFAIEESSISEIKANFTAFAIACVFNTISY